MSFSGFSFGFWRFMEIITLIPCLGMLSYFVNAYTKLKSLTPDSILVLFIVSVLGAAWAIGTLFLYTRAKHSANFVAFVDLLFVGAFIGAVYALRGIANADCTRFTRDSYFYDLGVLAATGNSYSIHVNKNCAMLKASFAFGIMNCIFFFLTFLLALMVHHHWSDRDRVVVKRETHYSRHGHRRSRSPRHSHHSSRRSHYV
ncbi:hypothetical protein K469DRAFT_554213 [Zopfia rhizophila CBS 207.26]|uniref:MARVEL domain-containing protein n=1 Tax=Zopfia rhizophila CBS 207.26 TaxID=1314779 RepID=A0A6A6EP19_9PEZI|nr:hypothetical protein K469DRAFT_554213 [Zopfia rhizophila CBS 207.26]